MIAAFLLERVAAGALFEEAVAAGTTLERGLVSAALGEVEAEAGGQTEVTVPVASEAIRSIGYRVGDIITVEFKRGGSIIYEYAGTPEIFMAFLNASSKGAFFNEHFQIDRPSGIPKGREKKVTEAFRVLRRTPGRTPQRIPGR